MTFELSVSLQTHLAQSAALHSRLCPRQVLGVRMARFACQWFALDPAIERKQLMVFMEIGRCAADGVMCVTYASPTNGLMHLIPYGKVAATFVDVRTGSALRVSEHPDCRAAVPASGALSAWQAQLEGYQTLSDNLLLRWQPVTLDIPIPQNLPKHAVTCTACGDRVNQHQHVTANGAVLCKACAFGAYYTAPEPLSAAPTT